MIRTWSFICLLISSKFFSQVFTSESLITLESIHFLKTGDLALQYGYKTEEHFVESPDGYVLMLHRLMPRIINITRPDRVVLLHHGMLSSSEIWILDRPDRSLAFSLSDQGYDVWLINARGTYYSQKHRTLLVENSTYWDFSWDEMGFYDMPVIIEYVKRVTGVPSIFFVGHSLGATVLFTMLAQKPEMSSSIRLASLLAPVAYLKLDTPLTKIFLANLPAIKRILEENNVNQLLPRNATLIMLLDLACGPKSLFINMCFLLCSLFNGNFYNISKERLSTVLTHLSAGSSLKTALHYLQCYLNDDFIYYDYGELENKVRYGQTKPPRYNLTEIKAPLALYYSLGDLYLPLEVIDRLKEQLPNVKRSFFIPVPRFTHDDFVMADNALDLVLKSVIDFMEIS